jgi:thioredoxin 1
MSRFNDLVNGDQPVLVDFTAAWCGPCKMMAPILQEVKNEMGERLTLLKVDVDRNPEAATIYGIQSVPTLILFKKGKQFWRHSGVISAGQLITKINEQLRS